MSCLIISELPANLWVSHHIRNKAPFKVLNPSMLVISHCRIKLSYWYFEVRGCLAKLVLPVSKGNGICKKSEVNNEEVTKSMNQRGATGSSDGETARIIVEFLEVAVNTIVFLKGVYPSGAFERCRYMNVVVQKSRHPQLRDYIHSTVHNLRPFIQKGLVERVAVIFFNNDNIPSERFVFKFTVSNLCSSSVEEGSVESYLRSFLVKLLASEPLTKGTSIDCRWEIVGYFSTLPEEAIGSEEAKLWTSTHTKQWQQPALITPIKSMSSEPLNMQLYLEHPNLSEQNSSLVIEDSPDRVTSSSPSLDGFQPVLRGFKK